MSIAQNKKALHDYFIEERFEAGLALEGWEVKAIRAGRVQLKEGYIVIRNAELFLIGAHIRPYEQGNRFNPDPTRDRKLLAHKHEIRQLDVATQQRGMTLVPLKAYFVDGRVKIEIGVARGKKLYDKRETIKERSQERDIRQRMKETSRE